MAFDSRLPAAYQEEGPVVTRIGTDHLVTFDYAEPSPIMLFFQRWWRRSILMAKVGVVVGAVLAYPVMTVMSHRAAGPHGIHQGGIPPVCRLGRN